MHANLYLLILLAVQASEEVPPPNPPPPPGPQLPIDGSLWILLLAGLIYGFFIVYKKKLLTNKDS